mgnify:CR=1 FL=1
MSLRKLKKHKCINGYLMLNKKEIFIILQHLYKNKELFERGLAIFTMKRIGI